MVKGSNDQFMPYAPGNQTVNIVRRVHEGTVGTSPLTATRLHALDVPEGNADRVQKAIRFLGIIDEAFELTEAAKRLRKSKSDEYPALLAELLQSAYHRVFEICDPASATATQLNNAFHEYDPAGQRNNMVALFMALCREASLAPPDTKTPRERPARAARKAPSGASRLQNRRRYLGSGRADIVVLHPALDAMLIEVKRKAETDEWTADERDRFIKAFASAMEYFLPTKKPGGSKESPGKSGVAESVK